MKARELRKTIHSFLDLVQDSAESARENEQELRTLLDRLAIGALVATDWNEDHPDAPRRDYGALRKRVAARFPNYGLYRSAGTTPDDEFLVGDAIDDITDIALDLSEVEWLWQNAGKAAAMWAFRNSFETHWGAHLRALQWYAHELRDPR